MCTDFKKRSEQLGSIFNKHVSVSQSVMYAYEASTPKIRVALAAGAGRLFVTSMARSTVCPSDVSKSYERRSRLIGLWPATAACRPVITRAGSRQIDARNGTKLQWFDFL